MKDSIKKQSIAGFISPDQLPGLLKEAAEVVGTENALILSDELGGLEIYLPKWTGDEDKLGKFAARIVECIGAAAAKRFCDQFGGTHIVIPTCRGLIVEMRNRAICAEARRGIKRADIARKYELTDRQIRRIISIKQSNANS